MTYAHYIDILLKILYLKRLFIDMTNYCFNCVDHYGKIVCCTSEAWQHIINHKECIGQEELIKAVIQKPDFINQDKNYKDRKVFYKNCVLNPIGKCFLRIVIKYSNNLLNRRKGRIITAFASDSEKKGEARLWPL
ncbi:hypothetical protein B1773_00470 [Dehalococcoides mccartyi]|nr:hypothetical protein B1773_00470 [Dehalococcoides mccartyi]